MEAYREILWAVMPYALIVIGVIFLIIIVLKILLYFHEKKQTSKPQDISRNDELLKLDEEIGQNDGNGSNTVLF